MRLRPHQQRILDANPQKALLCHEMRTGKSLIAKLWLEKRGSGVVVCMKQNKKDWEMLCPDAFVLTKEEFKKYSSQLHCPPCIVVDEAHNFAAPLFIAKRRSQLATELYTLIKENPSMDILLLTATPITNDPASLHSLLTYIGHYIPWGEYQDHFYELQYKPFLPRPAYFPKKEWRLEANRLLQKHADIVSLKDCVDSLPGIIQEKISVPGKPYEYAPGEDYHWTKDHKGEQANKVAEVKRLGSGHRKLIVVCHYTEQIDALAKELSKDKPTYVLDGRTEDHEELKRQAQDAPDCYFIVQAKMGMGWDGYMFGAMVFVSMAHRVIDHTQMCGRLTSVDYPKPCVYYYLIGGKWDAKIYSSIQEGEDFNPHKQ